MKEYKTIVGKKLIEILMFSMYPDAKIIYREYIQNARDAIKDAVKAGILQNFKDGHINVNIDKYNRKITIADQGIGVSVNEVMPVLLNIADSHKDGIDSAGQFGIGRLVGGGYCKKLSFKTSTKGENVYSEVIFDVEAARAILDNESDYRSAAEVVDAISTVDTHEEQADKHYFVVTLEDVRPDYPELLDEEIISEYLKEVAPIDYSLPFKNQLIATSLKDEFRELNSKVEHFRLSINNETNIHKRYGLKIEGTGDKIDELAYFKIEDDNFGLLAWGWYAMTAFSGEIPSSDKNRGIRLRKHNILIGATNLLSQFFREPRSNNYFYGEIHAIHPKLKPESSRSGLAPTPEALKFQELLRGFFLNLYDLYYLASKMKIATRDFVAAQAGIEQAVEHKDIPEVKQMWENAEKELIKAQKKLTSATNSAKAQTETGQKVVEIYQKKMEDIIKNPPAISTITHTNKDSIVSKPTVTATPKQLLDKFDVLKLKYSEKEVAIVRQAFKLLRNHCPSANTNLIDQLTTKVIKDLSK